MELNIRTYLDTDKPSTEALKTAIAKAVEAVVHRHHEMAPRRLGEMVATALYRELEAMDASNEEILKFAFETVVSTAQRAKEKEIERLIIEIDRLQRHLKTEEEELEHGLRNLFAGIEEAAETVPPQAKTRWIEALESTKLEHVEGLGILNETTEAALVAALEGEGELELSIREVVRHITHKALAEGMLNAVRIRAILITILSKAAETAEATPTKAEAIIRGTVYGINDALITMIGQIKEQLEFAPDEIKTGRIANWEELVRKLSRSDELYREIIEMVASQNSPFIAGLLRDSASVLGDQNAELKRISLETVDVAKQRLAALAKVAVSRGSELKEQLTEEAKRLGEKAWRKARQMAQNYKTK
jgi:hypothetical protein